MLSPPFNGQFRCRCLGNLNCNYKNCLTRWEIRKRHPNVVSGFVLPFCTFLTASLIFALFHSKWGSSLILPFFTRNEPHFCLYFFNSFKMFDLTEDHQKAHCPICDRTYSPSKGRSNLARHVKAVHPEMFLVTLPEGPRYWLHPALAICKVSCLY